MNVNGTTVDKWMTGEAGRPFNRARDGGDVFPSASGLTWYWRAGL